MGIKKHIPLIAILLVSLLSRAQQKTPIMNSNFMEVSTSESVFLHFNALTFVTGEKLFYKIYIINPADNKISQISKVAYVELLDSKRNSVFKHKLCLKNGTSQSDFFIPATLPTGEYKIIAYTNWMQNKDASKLFEQEIYIINPFEITPTANLSIENTSSESSFVENSESKKSNAFSNITLNKKVYSHREEVRLNIDAAQLTDGNYSISVRKKDNLPSPQFLDSEKFLSKLNRSPINSSKSSIVLPEFRGEIISGKIEPNSKENQIQNIPLAISIPGNKFIFKIVRTNKNGEFFFIIDQLYENPEFVVQVLGNKRNDYSIILNPKNNIDYSKIAIENNLKIDSKLKNDLISRSIASQIENSYFSRKTDSITALKKEYFYDPSSKEYKLDDYTRFSTLKQTITEVVTEMHYSKKDGKYSFYLKDQIVQSKFEEPAITLVDGILVPDVSDILNYNAKDIEKINIISKAYIYGGTVSSGIISIFTKSGNFSTDALSGNFYKIKDNLIPERQKTYFQQTYTNEKKDSRIPDFRYQLLWLPEVNLSQSQNQISFFTSDDSGLYEISIEGFTETGKPISLKENFIVE